MNPHRVWMPLVILCLAGIPSPVSPQARQNNTAPPPDRVPGLALSPLNARALEFSAYVISTTMLLDWLRDNCPQMNLDDAENRLAKLEALGQRYMPKAGAGHRQRQ